MLSRRSPRPNLPRIGRLKWTGTAAGSCALDWGGLRCKTTSTASRRCCGSRGGEVVPGQGGCEGGWGGVDARFGAGRGGELDLYLVPAQARRRAGRVPPGSSPKSRNPLVQKPYSAPSTGGLYLRRAGSLRILRRAGSLHAPRPRRRRDSPPRNIHVPAAAAPRLASAEHPRPSRGAAAIHERTKPRRGRTSPSPRRRPSARRWARLARRAAS